MQTPNSLLVEMASLLELCGAIIPAVFAVCLAAAAAVSLFHPEAKRRADARAVLRYLIRLTKRRAR